MNKHQSAFTLLELLVVMVIIAVLAGVSLPVFSTVLERGRATQDANNLRQVGTGLLLYLSDHDDQMFAAADNWPPMLNPKYVPSWRVFQSPFDRRTPTETPPAPVSYGINVQTYGTNVSRNRNPSQLIYMAPAITDFTNITFSWTSAQIPTLATAAGGASDVKGTHQKQRRINAFFADSHVATLTSREFTEDATTKPGKLRWDPLADSSTP